MGINNCSVGSAFFYLKVTLIKLHTLIGHTQRVIAVYFWGHWEEPMQQFSSLQILCKLLNFVFQMFPMALVTGNTSIIKPSERDPGACMMMMELCNEAGIPPGCVNVIHGKHDCK